MNSENLILAARVGYMDCLLDIQQWLKGQIGKLDADTLEALNNETIRLAAKRKAKEAA